MTDLLIVCHHYHPASTAESVRLSSFVRYLANEMELLVLSANDAQPVANERVIAVNGVGPWKRKSLFRAYQEWMLGWRFIRTLRKHPAKKVLVSSPPYICFLLIRIYLVLARRPFYHDLRDPYPELTGAWAGLFRPFERSLATRAVATTVCTPAMKQHYQQRYGGQVHCVPNGFDPGPGVASAPEDVLRIAVLGNMGPFQYMDWLGGLMEELSHLPVRFELIGSGTHQSRIKSRKNIKIHGRLPLDEARALIRTCHLGLNLRRPSAWNHLIEPVRTFEYIGAGLPQLMIPRSTYFRSLEEEGLGWAFDPTETETMIQLIQDLLSQPTLWEQKAGTAAEKSPNFTRERANEAWMTLLKKKQ